MADRSGLVSFKGKPITLTGDHELAVGKPAPDFTATAQDMSAKKLSDFKGKAVLLNVVPSLDTGVCDIQTKRLNQEVEAFGDKVVLLTLSMDLPMAQKRWCGVSHAAHVVTLSDYKDHSAGKALGLRMKENGLLARSVHVIDKNGVVQYSQIVPEMSHEPDYAPAVAAAKKLA